jgi:putative spermidine/putrescine transport system permease protein
MQRFGSWPALIVLALFFVTPLLALVPEAGSNGGQAFLQLAADSLFWVGLRNTILLGVVSAVVSVIVGTAIAVELARQPAHRRSWMMTLLGLPLAFSGLVIAYGFILAFGRAGFVTQLLALVGADPAKVGSWIYTVGGLALAYAYYLIPRVALTIYPVFANLDVRPIEVARTMGASRVRASVDIILPEVFPSIFSAGCLVGAIAMGTYGTALALVGTQVNILSLLLYQKVSDGGSDFSSAAALSLILLMCCSIFMEIGDSVVRQRERKLRREHN